MFGKKTPLDDIVSPLPAPLGDLVLGVVRRTKLWPGEKCDVARELTGHFVDGLETLKRNDGLDVSETASRLASNFGDERTAAKLIRRSKMRCRPLPWKAFVLSVRTFLVVFGLTALFAGWRMTGSPNPRINYLNQLNAATESIPESEKAGPVYREAIEQFHGPWGHGFFKSNRRHWYELTPEDKDWREVQTWLSECDPVIDLLKSAGKKPHLGLPYSTKQDPIYLRHQFEREQERIMRAGDPSFEDWLSKQNPEQMDREDEVPMLLNVLLPYFSPMRDMARMLVLRFRNEAAQGNITEAIDDLLAALQMGTCLLQEEILISQLVGAACADLANQGMSELLTEYGEDLSKDVLREIGHAWAGAMPTGSIRLRVEFERMGFLDTVQHVFTENPWGDGHLVLTGSTSMESIWGLPEGPFSWKGLGVAVMHAGRKETLNKFEDVWATIVESLSKPLYSADRRNGDDPASTFYEDRWNRTRYAAIMIMLPSLSSADEHIRRVAMRQEATLAAIALTAYRKAHGRYPARLAELVPGYLPRIPEDVYDGGALKYRLSDQGEPVLYSIWEDFVDDGGVPIEKSSTATHPKLGDRVYLGGDSE